MIYHSKNSHTLWIFYADNNHNLPKSSGWHECGIGGEWFRLGIGCQLRGNWRESGKRTNLPLATTYIDLNAKCKIAHMGYKRGIFVRIYITVRRNYFDLAQRIDMFDGIVYHVNCIMIIPIGRYADAHQLSTISKLQII